jgi:hypothetical protein
VNPTHAAARLCRLPVCLKRHFKSGNRLSKVDSVIVTLGWGQSPADKVEVNVSLNGIRAVSRCVRYRLLASLCP